MQPDPQSVTSGLLQTATTYLKVFSALDPSVIAHIQSDTYTHDFGPASTNLPSPLSRKEFNAHVSQIREVMHSFPVIPKKMWANPSLHQVVVWATAIPEFHEHVKDGDDDKKCDEWFYQGEYIYVLTMDPTGEKVENVLEFVDSKGTEHIKSLMARAWKNKGNVDAAGHGKAERMLFMQSMQKN
ncbi:hypothetical protein LTR64_003192 [Lithohypha guttulata]|uniref:uncharacterized protein n=1 Tax=Lithohypha guttulata TaxID=1690604 RepID=UPI00315D420D